MLYSKEQLHLGLSARRTGGGQRDQGSPVGESPSLEDGPGAGLSYVVLAALTGLLSLFDQSVHKVKVGTGPPAEL